MATEGAGGGGVMQSAEGNWQQRKMKVKLTDVDLRTAKRLSLTFFYLKEFKIGKRQILLEGTALIRFE